MDASGNIYEISNSAREEMFDKVREDTARLDGYLRGRSIVLTTTETMTGSTHRWVTIPMCPDLLRYDQLGEADNLRGRVVRAFFWLMRIWPE